MVQASIVCKDFGQSSRELYSHVTSLSLIKILVEDSLFSIAMSDSNLKLRQLLIVLELVNDKDELFETDLKRVRRII